MAAQHSPDDVVQADAEREPSSPGPQNPIHTSSSQASLMTEDRNDPPATSTSSARCPDSTFQSAMPFQDTGGSEFESMPEELRVPIHDIVIINAHEDRTEALEFKEVLKEIKLKDRPIIVSLLDEMFPTEPLRPLDLAVGKSVLVFLYVTANFCSNKSALFKSIVCLNDIIEDGSKKWCLVPIRTSSDSACRLPMELSALRSVKYRRGECLHENTVRRMLDSKSDVRNEKCNKLEDARREYWRKKNEGRQEEISQVSSFPIVQQESGQLSQTLEGHPRTATQFSHFGVETKSSDKAVIVFDTPVNSGADIGPCDVSPVDCHSISASCEAEPPDADAVPDGVQEMPASQSIDLSEADLAIRMHDVSVRNDRFEVPVRNDGQGSPMRNDGPDVPVRNDRQDDTVRNEYRALPAESENLQNRRDHSVMATVTSRSNIAEDEGAVASPLQIEDVPSQLQTLHLGESAFGENLPVRHDNQGNFDLSIQRPMQSEDSGNAIPSFTNEPSQQDTVQPVFVPSLQSCDGPTGSSTRVAGQQDTMQPPFEGVSQDLGSTAPTNPPVDQPVCVAQDQNVIRALSQVSPPSLSVCDTQDQSVVRSLSSSSTLNQPAFVQGTPSTRAPGPTQDLNQQLQGPRCENAGAMPPPDLLGQSECSAGSQDGGASAGNSTRPAEHQRVGDNCIQKHYHYYITIENATNVAVGEQSRINYKQTGHAIADDTVDEDVPSDDDDENDNATFE